MSGPLGDLSPNLLTVVLAAILSGGGLTALVSAYRARKTAEPEANSIIASGAESVVLSMEKVVLAERDRADRAEHRADELETALAHKDARIERLEARLDELQEALNRARDELHKLITADDD